MENAAINTVQVINRILGATGEAAVWQYNTGERPANVAIICGGGNNGGDGYAIARHLHNRAADVHIYATKPTDQLSGDAAVNASICEKMALPVTAVQEDDAIKRAATDWAKADVIVDALLGTGFRGDVREPMAALIQKLNGAAAHEDGPVVVAVDTPSGLDCQTGEASASTVRADVTVTFVARKSGFDVPDAHAYLGQVEVVNIGVPPELIERAASE